MRKTIIITHAKKPASLWKVLHNPDIGTGRPDIVVLNEKMTVATEAIQRLCFSLFWYGVKGTMTLSIAKEKYRVLYDWMRAFTNGIAGLEGEEADPPMPPHRDYINNMHMQESDWYFDKTRVCAGALLHGKISGTDLIVETLQPENVPTLDWLLDHPWFYFKAVNVNGGNFNQGGGAPVYVPLFSKFEARLKLSAVTQMSQP